MKFTVNSAKFFVWCGLLVPVVAGGCGESSAPLDAAAPAATAVDSSTPAACECSCDVPKVATPSAGNLQTAEEFPDVESYRRSPWLEPIDRDSQEPLNLRVTDQNGESFNLRQLAGQPLAMTFLYTRCTNPNKCPLVARRMAELQDLLQTEGLSGQVRLAIVSYDPDFDTPAKLKDYGLTHGLRFTTQMRMLQPDRAAKDEFFEKLKVTVNYDGNEVNLHGLQFLLFDARGLYVRSYRPVIWANADVLADLKRLVLEIP
jgi:protein SCO1/2